MRSRTVAIWGVLALSLAFGGSALAQQPDFAKAKKHYADAQKAMADGEFAVAARQYRAAYEITKDPVLFFNMAEANDRAGFCDSARSYYRRYLEEGNPDEEYRKITEERIAACGTQPAKPAKPTEPAKPAEPAEPAAPAEPAETAEPAEPAAPLPPPPAEDLGDVPAPPPVIPDDRPPSFLDEGPSWKRSAGWISVGVTLAAATTGAVLGLSAKSRQEDLENLIAYRDPTNHRPAVFEGNTARRYEDLRKEGKRLDTYAKVSFGVAGGAAAAAALFFVLDLAGGGGGAEAAGTGRLHPVVGADGLGLAAAWEF